MVYAHTSHNEAVELVGLNRDMPPLQARAIEPV
jgi:hypothetical protein